MRWLVMVAGLLAAAPAASAAGWKTSAPDFFGSFAAADARNGNRTALLDRGCTGTAWLVCDLELRDVPVRLRATLPEQRITEVQLTFSSRTGSANAAAALHTLARWAEPGASDEARRAAVLAILQGEGSRRAADLGGTRMEATQGFSGWTILARPR